VRVVQVSFHRDAVVGEPDAQLDAWPTLHGVASATVRAGVETTVVQPASVSQTLRRDGVRYEFVRFPHSGGALSGRAARWAPPARLIERVRAARPDVIHVQGFGHPVAVWHLRRAMGRIPLLVQDHASLPPGGFRRLAWKTAYSSLAGAVFTASAQADPYVAAGILRLGTPVHAVLEGSSTFTPGDQREARAATGLHGDPCVLWAGRLNANKDPLTLLEAFRGAAPSLPDARLWCCFGDAPLLDAVTQRIAQCDILAARVTLLGRRPHDEMQALYRAADLFVQLSHFEGSGYAPIEALACGTPPLVTDIPSLRAIVGDAGSLTPVGDAPAMAAAIRAWGGGDRAAQRRAARRRFESALSFDVIGERLAAVYALTARGP
jgi:glycosyltransferase involved in cell wall biosynthesis